MPPLHLTGDYLVLKPHPLLADVLSRQRLSKYVVKKEAKHEY